jgi:hypothetical protein
MKIKNKIFTLLGVFTLVGLTHSFTLKDLNASLTAPASYDINYSWDSVSLRQELGTTTIGGPSPAYTRTADGIYYNYSTLINYTSNPTILPDGLEITMTFDRSNTSWTSVTGGYIPTENKIGSDSSVGIAIYDRLNLKFDNQTNKDYKLILDYSSSGHSNIGHQMYYDSVNYPTYTTFVRFINTHLSLVLIPAYYVLELSSMPSSSNLYFDAWYLQDLGVSASYDAGYEQGDIDGYEDGLGNNPNVLLSGFQAMVGILVNFMLMILNLEVFGVSIMSVFGILALFVGVIWILKVVRG